MSVEQHAEAAVRYFNENKPPDRSSESAINTAAAAIVARHMQAAIDEATATFKARVAELEGLGSLVKEMHKALLEYINSVEEGDEMDTFDRYHNTLNKIDDILKGGA